MPSIFGFLWRAFGPVLRSTAEHRTIQCKAEYRGWWSGPELTELLERPSGESSRFSGLFSQLRTAPDR
ncbi:hypothetical protein WJX73_010440 [Symbiochloris irregularis]|uniref:Uncharacterized protein n=1 Tax=Symbiochloris irregularis TaxID=706552 RepID=A0AAW1PSK3_9CHLO